MPDNNIEWGQGGVNNSNDWGKAKANSTNNFGAVYDSSPSGDTNIVGGTTLSITYSASAYCDGIGDTPQPTIAGNTGAGTFSSTSGIIFADSGSNTGSSTGVIDVDASTDGATYVVTYTDTDSDIATANVTLNALDNAAFSYSASSYSQADTDPTPTITGLTGGTFSGTTGLVINSTTGEIDLSASTIASHIVTYSTSLSGSSVCPNTSTFGLAVTAAYSPLQLQFDTSGGKTITIPGTVGSSFTVDWGDTTVTTETGGTISHTYASGIATSTVSIGAQSDSGAFTKFAFNNSGSKSDLLDVPQWGSIAWTTFNSMFYGCNNINFQISATDYPDMSNATDMQLMFFNATYFNSNIDHWNVSTITNMNGTFREADNFNQSLNSWDVSNVTNFQNAFASLGGVAVFNGNISNWNMSSCENTSNMFYNQTSFNQDISGWSFSNNWVNANQMFFNASSFNQNLGSWNTSGLLNMSGMLRGCTNFNNNGGTLSAWDVSSVTTMLRMFQQATSFVGTGLDSWNPSSCTDFAVLFYSTSFNQNLNSWSLNSSLTSASSMFHPSSMSQANYTDTLVGWANTVFTNSAPYSVNFTGNSFSTKFDGTRSGGANFTTAQDAYNYLIGATASWSIS